MHLTVLLNVIAMSLDAQPLIGGLTLINLEYVNASFVAAYLVELSVRLLGLGVKNYVKVKFNIYDALLAILGAVDVILASQLLWANEDALFKSSLNTVLTFTRILRVFKLQRYWMRFQIILETLSQTIIDVRWFSILIAIFVFMYTILGMDFFSQQAKFNAANQVDLLHGVSPVFHFDDIMNSFFTVFVIITNDPQFTIFQSFHRIDSSKALAFFLTLVILGQKILVNLFLAFLLKNFDEGTMNQRIMKIKEDENQIGRMDSRISLWDSTMACFKTRIDLIIARIMSYDAYQRYL